MAKRKKPVKKKESKQKLPKQLKIAGKVYNTPAVLNVLKYRNRDLKNDFKILVYAIKKTTKTRLSLKKISDGLFRVRDNYVYKGVVPNAKSFDYTLLKALKFDDGHYPRNEVLDKITSAHNSSGVKIFRFHCFECRRVKYAGYNYTMVNTEQELQLFWEARDKYLKDVDNGSMIFSIYFAYEKYTDFVLIDFDNFKIDAGDEEEFRKILKQLINEKDYGTK